MRNIHKPIKQLMTHYASLLKREKILLILEKESIDSELEAKYLLGFLDELCEKVIEDAKANVIVLNQPIHTTDAEKICSVIEDYVEQAGYKIDVKN